MSSPSPETETMHAEPEATGTRGLAEVRLRRGDMLGRYIVLEEVGTGGMGVVYRAYDPRLGREVALKCVKTGRGTVAASSRLFREAQAMARLTHPNVLPVYDVDRIDGDVVMSMEFVSGSSVHAWFETKPPWQRVLAVMIDAGRGLAAAHEAGIVHRDFKPANVLLGEDDRVRVMDFGLARADPSMPSSSGNPASSAGDDGGDALATPLTQAGSVMGTPPYLAPEQFNGGAPVAASDQYSFCVALYEGLWGRRPFSGSDMRLLQEQRLRGPPKPKSGDVPTRLFGVIKRGLAPNPQDRYPSIDALLRDLAPAGDRKALWIGGGVVLAAGVAATFVATTEEDEPCATAGEAAAQTWDEGKRAELHGALAAERKLYGEATWERVEVALTRYADKLQDAYREACLATVRGVQSEVMLDARTHCLERRRQELSATIGVLVGDPTAADKAIDAVADLPSTDACADPVYTQGPASAPTDPAVRDAVASVREELATVRGLRRAGHYADAFTAAEAGYASAQSTGHAPAIIEARAEVGLSAVQVDKLDIAERELVEAYYAAGTVSHDEVSVEVAVALSRLTGHEFGRADEGMAWTRHAEMIMQRRPTDVRSQARLMIARANLDLSAGRAADGGEGFRAARQLLVDAFGEDHPEAASLLRSVAVAEARLGHWDAARALSELALEAVRDAYGPEHPFVPDAMRRLATVLTDQGDLDAALQWAQRALEIERRVMGERSRTAASTINLIGTIHSMRGEGKLAAEEFELALAINREILGPAHRDSSGLLFNLAGALHELGRFDEAKQHVTTGLEAIIAAEGPDHPDVATGKITLGLILESAGAFDEALAAHSHARDIFVKTYGPEHPHVAGALLNVGRNLVALRRGPQAVQVLQNACAQWDRIAGASAPTSQQCREALAQAEAL